MVTASELEWLDTFKRAQVALVPQSVITSCFSEEDLHWLIRQAEQHERYNRDVLRAQLINLAIRRIKAKHAAATHHMQLVLAPQKAKCSVIQDILRDLNLAFLCCVCPFS